MPDADLWDDEPSRSSLDGPSIGVTADPEPAAATGSEGVDDERWLTDAQVVVHDDDVGPAPTDDPLYDGRSDEAVASRMARWGQTSVFGASLYAAGLGIQKILDPKEPVEIQIQVDATDDEPDQPVTVVIDPDQPGEATAVVRPWLRH